jgi:septal ring factor EnvC (AmiA/AmiB activator)
MKRPHVVNRELHELTSFCPEYDISNTEKYIKALEKELSETKHKLVCTELTLNTVRSMFRTYRTSIRQYLEENHDAQRRV